MIMTVFHDAKCPIQTPKRRAEESRTTPCSFGGNGGMDFKDDYWGLYRDYCRDTFPHSLLSARETRFGCICDA